MAWRRKIVKAGSRDRNMFVSNEKAVSSWSHAEIGLEEGERTETWRKEATWADGMRARWGESEK